jgi:ribonuclease III
MSQVTPPDADLQQLLLKQCEFCLGYVFRDKSALLSALTHASSAEHRLASNERLEFLGDAILGMVVCELLYQTFPDYSEGDLTRVKSSVVSRQTCARISTRLGLERFLILGKGMAGTPQLPSSLLADVFESLIAAIYLDGGYAPARIFVERELVPEIEAAVQARGEDNYKSQLQQLAQRDHGSTPSYQLLDESGPDHSKCFQVAAMVGDRQFAPAWGRNKKEAEQLAARHALLALNELDNSLSPSADDSSHNSSGSVSPAPAAFSG